MSASEIIPTAPLVNASRFRAAHAADWARLERIVTQMEKRSVRALDDDDLLALPSLYRTALSSLSVVRETSLDRSLATYLERLCTRAYFQLYGVQTSLWQQLARFFVTGWPRAVQAMWKETLFCFALLAAAGLAGFFLVRSDPAWFYAIVPGAMSSGRDPTASAEMLRATIYGEQREGMLAAFATFLFTHNSQVAIFAFALGFAFAIPTLLLVAYNGLSLGAMVAVFVDKGLGTGFAGWLTIHGTTELFAVTLAAAAGVRIGTAVAFPGRRARADAAVVAGRSAAVAMAGVVAMLFIAGVLEGIGRQTVQGDALRYGIGIAALIGWLAYFYLPRRAEAGDALAVSR
ncbi:stage II sporulation protein M [Sphingomonas radiodurans]|uniref:stage II sporulation protein M n=1 Tax=Sphingomonas radiodurans TaxID=2890321 RepID=UPI001E50826B|nr:stage II sporulation protein M [Sphingomonas radiodurans]WBH18161.1 stage II sporulation protein M [Sphingomonas radiodurans]